MIILLSCLYSRIRAYLLLLHYLLLSTYPTLSCICPNSGYLVYVPCPAYTPKFIPVPLSSPTYCYLPILPFPVYVPIHNYPPYSPLPIVIYLSYPILPKSLFSPIPDIVYVPILPNSYQSPTLLYCYLSPYRCVRVCLSRCGKKGNINFNRLEEDIETRLKTIHFVC